MSGILLKDAVVEHGDLARPRSHKAFGETFQLRAMMASAEIEMRPLDDERLTRYIDDQAAAEARVLEKLRSGELIARGFESGDRGRGSEAVAIPPARWNTLDPDFASSRALDSGEVIAVGLLIYPAPEDCGIMRTGLPGRPTRSKTLIADEFERRIAAGEVKSSLNDEVSAILKWLQLEHPMAERPAPKTLKLNITKRYRELPACRK